MRSLQLYFLQLAVRTQTCCPVSHSLMQAPCCMRATLTLALLLNCHAGWRGKPIGAQPCNRAGTVLAEHSSYIFKKFCYLLLSSRVFSFFPSLSSSCIFTSSCFPCTSVCKVQCLLTSVKPGCHKAFFFFFFFLRRHTGFLRTASSKTLPLRSAGSL